MIAESGIDVMYCLWYSHANGESRGDDRRISTCSCSQCATREASRIALAVVRATTLPVTSESTHRLPSCSCCLFTFSIHSNNVQMFHAEYHLHLPTHRSNISHVLSHHATAQRNTTRHDVTAASLPYLSYPRYLTTLLITPFPSLSSPSQTQHPSHLSSPSQT
jgi:hypothetical protein